MQRTLAAFAFTSLAACHPAAPPIEAAPPLASPSSSAPPIAKAEAPAAPLRRVAVFLRAAPQHPVYRVYRVSDDAASARDLGFTVQASGEGAVGVGADEPRISPDGAWLAYGDEGRLWLRRLDGSPAIQITKHTQGHVQLLLGGFSPDGQKLLFHQGEHQGENESAPLPPGVTEGFYVLRLADMHVAPAPSVPAFDAWDADSRHVIFDRQLDGARHALERADTAGGAVTRLTENHEPYGYSQLVGRDREIAYVASGRIVRSMLDGSGLVPVSPPGAHAEYQWPRWSVDGARIAYQHGVREGTRERRSIEVVTFATGERAVARSCERGCDAFAWESATSLLVQDRGVLYRVAPPAAPAVVGTGVGKLVVAGP